jgi:hypothetical protein
MLRLLLSATVALGLIVLAVPSPVHAAGPSVTLVSAPLATVTRGQAGLVRLRFHIAGGYHINSHKPKEEFLIPTALKLDAPTDIAITKTTYPPAEELSFEFDPNEKLSVYTGDFTITVGVRPLKDVTQGKYAVHGTLRYQACDNRACYPPKTLPVDFEVKVQKATTKPSIHGNRQSPHIHK